MLDAKSEIAEKQKNILDRSTIKRSISATKGAYRGTHILPIEDTVGIIEAKARTSIRPALTVMVAVVFFSVMVAVGLTVLVALLSISGPIADCEIRQSQKQN